MDKKLNTYLTNKLPPSPYWMLELEQEAAKENIPIVDKVSMNFLKQFISVMKPRRILEIGTGIGYSALRMLEAYPKASILSFEQDTYRYEQAIANIARQNKQANIKVIHGNVLEKLHHYKATEACFDFVFIDAAKGQYKRYFELVYPLVNTNGVIVSDNVLFRDYVVNPDKVTSKYKKMVKKIRDYNEWLARHPDFQTSILPIGDGVAISYKVTPSNQWEDQFSPY